MKKVSLFYIITASILWGTSGLFVHFMSPLGFSSLHMTFLRAFVTTVFLGIYILIRRPSLFKITFKELFLYLGCGITFFATASCYFFSMQITSVSTAVMLMYTAPIYVIIYSVSFLDEKLNATKVLSVMAMLLGGCLVSGVIGGFKFNLEGIIYGFLSSIAYSLYNIFVKIGVRKNCNPLSSTFYCFLFASLIAFFCCKPDTISVILLSHPYKAVPLAVGIGVFTCILPYFLYTLSLKHLPVGTASAFSVLEPAAATFFSIVFLSETLDIYSICGMFLILAAAFFIGKTNE